MSAIDPVTIDFAVRGLTDVTKAFETVEQRMLRFEKQATGHAVAESQTRIKAAKAEGTAREKVVDKTAKEVQTSEKKVTETALAEGKKVQREVERLEAYKLRVRQRSGEMAGQYAAKQAAEEIRAAEKAAAGQIRAGEKAAAAAKRSWGRLSGGVGRAAGNVLGSMASMASMTLGIGGGAILADAVKREMSAEKSAALFINQVTSKGAPPPGATVAAVLGQASQVSKETGMTEEEIIQGTRAYAKTARGGDYKGAMANMGFFAKMARVTDTDIGELGGAAGMLQAQNADLAKDPAKMRQMLLDVLAQSKAGGLGMTEFIAQAGKMGSSRGAYAGDETTVQRKLFALGQIAVPSGGDRTGTDIADMGIEVTQGQHKKQAIAAGVKFNERGQIMDVGQMISAVFKSTNGDIGKITDIFGKQGGTVFRELAGGYAAARDAGGKGEAGIKAGDKYLTDTLGAVSGSTMSAGDLTQQFEQTMATPTAKFEKAMNSLIDTLEDKAEPYLVLLANKLEEAAPTIGVFIDEFTKLIDEFARDPFAGLGKVFEVALTAQLVQASIGKLLETALTTKLGGGVAIAGALFEVGKAVIDILDSEEQHRQRVVIADTNEAANLASKLGAETRSGTVTAADVKNAEGQAGAMAAKVAEQEKIVKEGRWGIASDERHARDVGELKNFQLALKALTDVLPGATKSFKDVAAAAGEAAKNDPARSDTINARNPVHP